MRLYKDGVFHSHYNPGHKVTRGVWDLLVLPTLLHPPGSIQRVLLLGVGGGAAIHLLNHFVQPSHITAIELDPLHITVAKRFFKINHSNTQLIENDAIAWVKRKAALKKPPTFDLIIDDLYGEEGGEPVRAIQANEQWCSALHTLLSKDGLLVSNFVTRSELHSSAYCKNKAVKQLFNSRYKFTNPLYQNQIGAFSKRASHKRTFRHNITLHRELSGERYQKSFKFRAL